jgi:hypothetical protein
MHIALIKLVPVYSIQAFMERYLYMGFSELFELLMLVKGKIVCLGREKWGYVKSIIV